MSDQLASSVPATQLCMHEVGITNLRCHEEIHWQCHSGLNLIVGTNGSGKTTLLESVYMMAHGRSFRQARDPQLVRRGEKSFAIHGRWRRFGPMNLSVTGKRGKTTLRLQGRDVARRRDISDSFPVLVEAPQGRRVIDGVPGERRRWLDSLVLVCHPQMLAGYEAYLRAVMQRARLLRRRASGAELDAWEQQIVHHGLPVTQARNALIARLNDLLSGEAILTEHPLVVSTGAQRYDRQTWLDRLADKREEDARRGSLRFGPHCDNIHIHWMDREIRSAGSRGQQKLAGIALKLAECTLWENYRRLSPVLLLDDCLEALDQQRQQRLLKRLHECPSQVLMTAPDKPQLSSNIDVHVQRLDENGFYDDSATDSDYSPKSIRMEEAA